MITYVLIAVICTSRFSISCPDYEQRMFDSFLTSEECQQAAERMQMSGIAIRWYCKGVKP